MISLLFNWEKQLKCGVSMAPKNDQIPKKQKDGVTTKVAQDCLHIQAAYRNTLLNQHFGVSISQRTAWMLFSRGDRGYLQGKPKAMALTHVHSHTHTLLPLSLLLCSTIK